MAYTSKIDIKLGETPKAREPEMLGDLVDLYNACHILNNNMNSIRDHLEEEANKDGPAWKSAQFKQFLNVRASQEIRQGDLVCIANWGLVESMYRPFSKLPAGLGYGAVRGWVDSMAITSSSAAFTFKVPYTHTMHQPIVSGRGPRENQNLTVIPIINGVALESGSAGETIKVAIGEGALKSEMTSGFLGQQFVVRYAVILASNYAGQLNGGVFDPNLYAMPDDPDYPMGRTNLPPCVAAAVRVDEESLLFRPPQGSLSIKGGGNFPSNLPAGYSNEMPSHTGNDGP